MKITPILIILQKITSFQLRGPLFVLFDAIQRYMFTCITTNSDVTSPRRYLYHSELLLVVMVRGGR